MAERHRSKDGRSETEEIVGDTTEVAEQGRSGGELSRKVGTRDEVKGPADGDQGNTRVRKGDEIDGGTK
ncbi:hypothetical protein E0K89_017300 [Aquicoccus sp. SCR17]|nr:hypothetical protein [Carideicomes alvinocaridis]